MGCSRRDVAGGLLGVSLLTLTLVAPSSVRASESPPADAGAQVVVTGSVQAMRLLVADESGELLQVWSNTDQPTQLEVRLGSRSDPEAALTADLRAAHDQIAPTLAEGDRGLVYRR